jgi:hypothetical protein
VFCEAHNVHLSAYRNSRVPNPIKDPGVRNRTSGNLLGVLDGFPDGRTGLGKVLGLTGQVVEGTEAIPERLISDNLVLHLAVSETRLLHVGDT